MVYKDGSKKILSTVKITEREDLTVSQFCRMFPNVFVRLLNLLRRISALLLLFILFCDILIVLAQTCKPVPPKTSSSFFNNGSIDYILSRGISEMEMQSKTAKHKKLENDQAIFVLGNTGSGKTTATQIIAGDLSRIHATRSAGSLIIIDDDNRIGAPSTTSKTLLPEYVVHPEIGDVLWDCPGFYDNRGSKTDIAAMYFLNYALNSTKSAKFLVTTTHASLKPGNRIDFPLLSSHLVRLFTNIEKFSDSIGLVVTRVASFDPETGEDLTDYDLREQVTEFLLGHMEDLRHQEERFRKEKEESKVTETQNKLKFVRGLLTEGANNKPKIFFLRGPRQCGALSSFPQVLATRKKLTQQYTDNLIYSLIATNDFKYNIQDSTLRDVEQIYVPEVIDKISQIIDKSVADVGTKFFEKFYEELPSNTSAILSRLEKGYQAIEKYFDAKNPNNLLTTKLATLHADLVSNSYFASAAKLAELEKQLEFFNTYVTQKLVVSTSRSNWSPSPLFLQNKIIALQKFYMFCKQTEQLMGRKKIQNDLRIYLRKNTMITINESNVFEFIRSTSITQIEQDTQVIWNTTLGSSDKTYFLNSVRSLLPTLYECIRIPTTKSYSNSSMNSSLEQILSEGTAKMESDIARGPLATSVDRKAVFILGNSGSGKTTVAQIMAGNLKRLHATYAEGNSLVIIDDDNNIGAPTTRSKTLVPNYVIEQNNSGNVMWDCPGFQDNRGPEIDIAAMYFLKHALTLTTSAKFIFTVPQSSVTIGNVRDDFDTMATHAVRLIRNIGNFSRSIGLIVTKVNSYSSQGYVDDAEMLHRTVGFLLNYKHDLVAIIKSSEIGQNNREVKDKLTFVNIIINNVEGVPKPRIAFIRSPADCGTLDTMQEIKESRQMSQTLCRNELQYTPIDSRNLNISLSAATTLEIVNVFAPNVHQSIQKSTCEIAEQFKAEFLKVFYKSLFTDTLATINNLYNTHMRLKQYLQTTGNSLSNISYANSLKKFHKELFNEFSCSKFDELSRLEDQLEFYRDVTSKDVSLPHLVVSNNMCYQSFLEMLSNYSEFYQFCRSIANQLREYDNQKKLQNLVDSKQVDLDKKNALQFLFENGLVEGHDFNKSTSLWSNVQLDDKQYLVELIREVKPDMTLDCQQSQIDTSTYKLILTGRIIMVSRAFDKLRWSKAHCQPLKVKELQIVAMEMVIFDVDIEENANKILISVIAPVWDIKLFGSNRRQINLNGADGLPYPDPATRASTAKTGVTGGNAGSFFGIVENIKNEENLFISANGGNGGPGQTGADGLEGYQGRAATYNDLFYGSNVKSVNTDGKNYYDRNRMTELRTAFGEPGGQGENGGNGGTGGTAGIAGSVNVVFIRGNSNLSRDQISAKQGNGGAPGKGGKGGRGGRYGNSYSCHFTHYTNIHHTSESSCGGSQSSEWNTASGRNGESGQNATQPSKSSQSYEPWQVIVQYRRTHFGKFVVPSFSLKLEQSPYVNKSHFSVSFAEEIQKMEEVFYKSYHNTNLIESNFVSYYESFLERIQGFASTSNIALSPGKKLALNEISTAVLGKIAGLRRHEFQLSVIKTKSYLDTVVNRLNVLKTVQKDEEILQHTIEYSTKFIDAINEATNHISNSVQPAIQECQRHVDQVNTDLHREILKFLDDARTNVELQKELKQKAEKAAVLRTIMGVIGIAGAATQFLGPAGMAVGSLISTGSSIAQSLAFGPNLPSTSFQIPIPVAGTLTSANKDYYQSEIKKIRQMSTNVVKATSEIDDNKLQYLKQNAIKLNSLVARVEIGVENNNFIDTMRAKQEADELASQMKQAVLHESQKLDKAEKTKTKNANIIRNLIVTMGTIDAVAQVVINHQSSSNKVEELADAIKQAEQQVKVLEAKKEQFYDEFLPAMESMFNAIEADTNNLQGTSRVSQMVEGWEMKTTLRKMRHYIKQYTTGMSVSEEFQVCLDLLDEALTLMLGLYDLMENFKDKIDLANYIANVQKANTRSTGNRELDLALSQVSIIVQSNLMLEEYQQAKRAFKQWVFPFANHYLYDAPAVYGKFDNLNDIVNLYTKEIEHLQSELAVYQATTVSRDISLIFETFSSDTVSTESFYVWNSTNWRWSIKKLISGEPVKLLADVDMYGQANANYFQYKAAIKVKTVEVKFRTRNADLQSKLDQKLKYFRMKLEHTGQSMYKVFNKHYVIGRRPQTYRYSFEKNHNGHVSRNGVQYKVQGGDVDYMLSPYTWWVLQLEDSKPDDNINFEDLNEFVDEIDLELEGEGVYVDETTVSKEDREKLNLDEHYESIDPALFDVQGKEDLYGLC